VPEERPVHQVLLDCLVYAPLGAAIVAVEEVPRLAEVGRERVEKQLAVARLVGKFAVGEGRRRFGASPPTPRRGAGGGPDPSPESPTPDGADLPLSSPSGQAGSDGETSGAAVSGASEPSEQPASELGRELPIPGYDTLAASQVVERLASLTPGELEVVRRHEAATRRRRTVLHRIAQLSSERDIATA
jgi:hypothetical protein